MAARTPSTPANSPVPPVTAPSLVGLNAGSPGTNGPASVIEPRPSRDSPGSDSTGAVTSPVAGRSGRLGWGFMHVAFGPFVLDAQTRELTRDGDPLHVPPKAFRLLEILIEERPRAVAREELIERVWPGLFVGEGNLTSRIAQLRKALGDRPRDPRYLRTVHGYGYAFCASAVPVADRRPDAPGAQVRHLLAQGVRKLSLSEGENLLGREPDAAVWLDHPTVSRCHACIVVAGSQATLEDLRSKNGTFRGSQRVTGRVLLADGDRLKLGSVWLTYRRLPLPAETKSADSQVE